MSPVVHVAGPRGIGSSTVAFALFRLLIDDGVRTGYVDLSQLQLATPPSPPDELYRNLAALVRGHRTDGARAVVITGRCDVRLAGSTVVWLTADLDDRRERLALRRDGHGPPICGDDLSGRPHDEIAALAVAESPPPPGCDLVLDTTGVTADGSARRLRHLLPAYVPAAPPGRGGAAGSAGSPAT